jgi:hypothetical protein
MKIHIFIYELTAAERRLRRLCRRTIPLAAGGPAPESRSSPTRVVGWGKLPFSCGRLDGGVFLIRFTVWSSIEAAH